MVTGRVWFSLEGPGVQPIQSVVRAFQEDDVHAETDIISKVSSKRITYELFCECKFRNSPMGNRGYSLLQERVRCFNNVTNPRYILFPISGFEPKLGDLAEEDGSVISIGPGSYSVAEASKRYDIPFPGDHRLFYRNVLSAPFYCILDQTGEHAAAGDLHPDYLYPTDIAFLQDGIDL